jgi:hypothetical protein
MNDSTDLSEGQIRALLRLFTPRSEEFGIDLIPKQRTLLVSQGVFNCPVARMTEQLEKLLMDSPDFYFVITAVRRNGPAYQIKYDLQLKHDRRRPSNGFRSSRPTGLIFDELRDETVI